METMYVDVNVCYISHVIFVSIYITEHISIIM